ncbi:probable ATP-dependent RNA helicase DDX31 [Gouania willdenowi]|uniref:probable ATP-dependent RNA helicase DDX31 n=1 Tax=Gouania willdenowi TaxID=441366 RepID=UPI001056C9A3|nr:probable ATP-dependent RNA helicase DDX31 [Gouania willdenowi]
MMSSSVDEQLFVNICSDDITSLTSKRKRPSSQQRWNEKKKRRSFSSDEQGKCSNQRESLEQTPPPDILADQTPPQTKKKKKEEKKEPKHCAVKTSSLFKNNPEIPDISRPVVSQLKEKIFTSDSFSELDLHPHLVATLNKVLNISTLTSVQKQTVPALLSGKDAMVRSQTGSGKTLCYALPVVQNLQGLQPKVSRGDGPLALVIVPTRELALQTFNTFQKLLKPFTWIVPGVLMGGEKRKSEKARLRKGINILVSTPGRLVDHIKHTLSIAFSAVRWLVLDEADRILDLGFEKDLTLILNSLNSTGPTRQNVLLSATLTHGVTRLADVCLNDPISIHVSGLAPSSHSSDPSSQSESFAVPVSLQQFVVVVPSKVRLVCLAAFILDKCKFSKDHKLMVFISSCEAVEFLHSLLSSVLSIDLLRLHGNMKQEERSEVFQQFSASPCGVLLCTDVAARGLDLPQVTWSIQYTPPTTAAEYVHRVGRTARIGEQGSSLLFLTPAETAFITELANHNISLSEMKLQDVLACLMLDNTYKGRGKYHSTTSSKALQQEVRERATVLQTEFENFVHSDARSLQAAKKALQSFLRSYTTYPAHLKHAFHIRSLHLGHTAKSFGLRDAPSGLTGNQTRNQIGNQNRKQTRKHKAGDQRIGPGQRVAGLLRLEVSNGLQGGDQTRKRRKKKQKGRSEDDDGQQSVSM